MLAGMVDHVIGVDPDRDWVTAAVLDAATAGVLATGRFRANGAGYRQVMAFADGYSTATERAWAIEGTASYGRGLTAALARDGEWVIEFDRATQKPAKDGSKTDELDAIRAARETLGRARLASPRAHRGFREALRVHGCGQRHSSAGPYCGNQRAQSVRGHRRRHAPCRATWPAHPGVGETLRRVSSQHQPLCRGGLHPGRDARRCPPHHPPQ